MKNSALLSSLPLYDQLLLAVTDSTTQAAKRTALMQQFTEEKEWDKLIKMAHVHAVIPQLYQACRQHKSMLPKDAWHLLQEHNRTIAFENMHLSAELLHIVKALQTKSLRYISIKGPLLSQQLYGNVTTRQICDLDILVDENDLRTIAKVLMSLGYESALSLSLLENEGFISRDNDLTFLHPHKKIAVELHWKLFPKRHKMPLDFNDLYANIQQVTLQKEPVNVLSTQENLLYLTLHASKHIFEQLKWVCDIDRLIRNNPDLDLMQVYNRAQNTGVTAAFSLGLMVSQRLYNTPIDKAILAYVTPEVEQLIQKALQYFSDDFTTLDEPTKKRLRFLFLHQLNNEKQNRFVTLLVSAFKPSSVDYIYYNLPSQYNFLYPLLRPPRLLYKYLIKKIVS